MAGTKERRVAKGLCRDCGEERGPAGTEVYCPSCAKAHSRRQSAHRVEIRASRARRGLCLDCGGKRTVRVRLSEKEKRAGVKPSKRARKDPLCEACRLKKREADQRYRKKPLTY